MSSGKVKCTCGWSWNKSDSSKKDMYICHECGRDNSNNMKNGGWLDNYNDSEVSLPEGYVGEGYNTKGRNYSPAWGGQFQMGGYVYPVNYVPQAQMGGSIPGAVGFSYARTQSPAPSNGPYAKKTKASAQKGKAIPKFNLDNFKKKQEVNLKEEPREIVRDNTRVVFRDEKGKRKEANPNKQISTNYDKRELERIRKEEEKQIVADRKARIADSMAAQKENYTSDNWRELLARETQATGDKFRLFPEEDSFIDNWLNPAAMIGNMASGLGRIPLDVSEGNYGSAALSVAMPLGVGALAGMGAPSNAQFVNNIANPLAGIKNPFRKKQNIDFSNYLTPKEAAAARAERMLAQESKWQVNSNTYTRDKFENINDNFEEIFANEIGKSPEVLGTNALGKAFVFKDNGLSAANQSRVAAHETGHFYRNMADEANEWNSFFDFSKLKHRTNSYLRGKPTASKTSSYSVSEPKVEGLNLQKQGVPHGDEIRERAAQLKDYIAQKNNIPLNKDFIVTEAQLDDAIKNYVKDTGLDNTMTPMLNSLKDKKGFLKAINKYALGVTPLGLVAASQTGEEKPVPGMRKGGIIKDDMGQWNHPGEITEIDSNQITMQGVPYDVLGISDEGDTKLMKPGKNYKFKGKKVTEFPMAKNGLRQEQKGLVNLDQLTNFTNYNTKQPGGWLDKY